jgi:hypothetical protein
MNDLIIVDKIKQLVAYAQGKALEGVYTPQIPQEAKSKLMAEALSQPITILTQVTPGSFAESPEYLAYLDKHIEETFKERNVKAEIQVGREHLMQFFQGMMLLQEDINTLRKEYGTIITNSTNIEEVGKSLLTLNDKINALDFQLSITKTIFDAYKEGL